jgi:hypothetical protein
MLFYDNSQTICKNKYLKIDLLFILPVNNDLWLTVLGKFPKQYSNFEGAKEGY